MEASEAAAVEHITENISEYVIHISAFKILLPISVGS